MQRLNKIGMVVIIMIFAIVALVVAARGQTGVPYWGGIGFFLLCVLLSFFLVHQMTGAKTSRH